jgi:hypothetical protein
MKGIMLNYDYHMWHGVLQGNKVQTRRNHATLNKVNHKADNWDLVWTEFSTEGKLICRFKDKTGNQVTVPSRYQLGEIVYLQEPVLNLKPYVTDQDEHMYRYCDKAGDSDMAAFKPLIDAAVNRGAKWENKMYMSKKYARFYIKITGIKTERLAAISNEDCIKEGIMYCKITERYFYFKENVKVFFKTPQLAYFSLLQEVGKEGEEPNPWLFAYDFELCYLNN